MKGEVKSRAGLKMNNKFQEKKKQQHYTHHVKKYDQPI